MVLPLPVPNVPGLLSLKKAARPVMIADTVSAANFKT